MKLNQFVLIIIFLYLLPLQSQEKAFFGMNVGMTISEVNYSSGLSSFPLVETSPTINFTFGLAYQFYFNNVLGIESQFNYLGVGTGYSDIKGDGINDVNSSLKEFNTSLKYINLPLKLVINPFGKDFFRINSGLYVSRIVSAKNLDYINLPEYPSYPNFLYDENFYDRINPYDYGILFGVGGQLRIKSIYYLSLDINYNQSLSKSELFRRDVSFKNQFLSIQFGLKYKI